MRFTFEMGSFTAEVGTTLVGCDVLLRSSDGCEEDKKKAFRLAVKMLEETAVEMRKFL